MNLPKGKIRFFLPKISYFSAENASTAAVWSNAFVQLSQNLPRAEMQDLRITFGQKSL